MRSCRLSLEILVDSRYLRRGRRGWRLLLLFLTLLASTWWCAGSAQSGEPIEFNRDVRAILSDRCFACHGHDSGSREADLRLDEREDAFADRGGYHVVLPGNPDQSELITRIDSDDDDMRMPPAEFGKPLSKKQREVLVRWVTQGAPWEGHWSLSPVVRPDIPARRDSSWGCNAIDRFVLTRLQSESLQPAAVAERRTLIRRLHVDLTGLPPRPEEVRAFVQDESLDGYDHLVDRLLASCSTSTTRSWNKNGINRTTTEQQVFSSPAVTSYLPVHNPSGRWNEDIVSAPLGLA